MELYHLKGLTKEERDALNNPETGGWGSSPRFARYADITTGFGAKLLPQVAIALLKGEYELVAHVAGDDLEDAFRYTNHIETSWHKHPAACVAPLPGDHRSTSVGDVVVRDGRTYVVAPVGFKLLTAEYE
jgi:hypothetical protein